jgi:type IV pilus assembly protein PilC
MTTTSVRADLSVESGSFWGREFRLRKRVRLADQAWLARQLAVLARAGLGLPPALGLLAHQRPGKAVGDLAKAMREELLAGRSPSSVTKAHEDELGPLFSAMVGAGETAGVLPTTLAKLADLLETRLKLRKKTRAAVSYPSIVMGMAVLLALVILLAVVPIFSRMFAQFGASLPGPTKVLVSISHFLVGHVYVVPILAVALAAGLWQANRDERVHYWASATALRLPVVGPLLSKAALARVASTIATMMGAGTDVLTVLAYAAQSTQNRVWATVLGRTPDLLRQGRSFSEALRLAAAGTRGVDGNFEVLAQMVEVGERSGSTPEVLGHLAQGVTEEVETGLETLESSLEPVLIMFVGAIVGTMIVALYLPIFHIITVLGRQTPTSGG